MCQNNLGDAAFNFYSVDPSNPKSPDGKQHVLTAVEHDARVMLLPAIQDEGLLLPAVQDDGLLLPAVQNEGSQSSVGQDQTITVHSARTETVSLPAVQDDGLLLPAAQDQWLI